MRVPYRQGLIAANAGQLVLNSNSVDIVINPYPVIATASQGPFDYLIQETNNVPGAWGPFSGSITQYLYWQISTINGTLSRGSTTLAPIVAATAPPSPAVGQFWFDTTHIQQNQWNGSMWVPIIAVFAATLVSGATLVLQPFASQVGLNTPIESGFVASDGFGNIFRDLNGNILTSETIVTFPGTGSQVKFDGALLQLQANQSMGAGTLVYILNGQAAPASSAPSVFQVQAPIAMLTENVFMNQSVQLAFAGRIVNNLSWGPWTASQWGLPVYCDNAGNVTLTKPSTAKYVRVGTITGTTEVLLSFDWETDVPSIAPSGVNLVSATAPLTVTGTTEFPIINIPQVTSSVAGYLDAADYVTFLGYGAQIATKVNLITGSFTVGDLVSVTNTGGIADSGVAPSLFYGSASPATTAIPQSAITGLAAALAALIPTVPSAVQFNFPWFISGGILADSGYNANSFAPFSIVATVNNNTTNINTIINTDLPSKADIITGSFTPGDLISVTNTGDIADSGFSPASFAPASSTASEIATLNSEVSTINSTLPNKINTVPSATIGDFAQWTASGQLTDNGLAPSLFYGTASPATTAIPQSAVTGLSTSLASKVSKSGDTMTGGLTISLTSAGTSLQIGPSGGPYYVAVQSSGEVDLSGSAGTSGQVFTSGGPGSPPSWTTVSGGGGGPVTIDPTSSNSNFYPTLVAANSGSQQLYADNANALFYNPSTSTLTVPTVVATLNGNATSATNATTATNIAGGALGSLPYQTSSGTTSFIAIGATGQVLTVVGGIPQWTIPSLYTAGQGLVLTSNTFSINLYSSNTAPTNALWTTTDGVTFSSASNAALFLKLADIGAIATTSTLVNGAGYVNGTYTFVPLTGGTGAGAQATVVVSGNAVTSVTITYAGSNYTVGDILSASNANLGGAGAGFSITVATITKDPGLTQDTTGLYVGLGQITPQMISSPDVFVDVDGAGTGNVALGGVLSIFGTAAQGVVTSISAGAQGSDVTITVNDATTSTKGVASFNPADFTVSAGAVSLVAPPVTQNVVVETSAYNANPNDYIIADTSGAAFTVTLPATPTLGEVVWFVDGAGTWATNNLTIAGNGSNILGLGTNLVANQNRENFSLIYYNSAQGWIYGA